MIAQTVHIACIALVGQCPNYIVEAVAGPNCGIIGVAGAIGWGISESGTVCGWFSNCASYERPFYWPAGGGRTEITFSVPYVPSGGARAHALSDPGIVVGVADVVGSSSAFRFEMGQTTLLQSLPGDYMSTGLGVNSLGYVVGTSTGALFQACVWFNGLPSTLNLPLGPSSAALDINENNQIAGWMGSDDPTEGTTAFIWHDGTTTSLPPPLIAFNHSVRASALNNRGDACGIYFTYDRPSGNYVRQACAWIGGQVVLLGTLPGTAGALALDINDAREIVGYCTDVTGNDNIPFIWRNGEMHALNALVPAGSPLLGAARGINNKGQITGEGVTGFPAYSIAFLLTPALPAHAGDFNCDAVVNVADLLGVIVNWNPQGPVGGNPADLNRDNRIDLLDLIEVIQHWD